MWSILIAAVAAFVFSAVWYTFLFGKTWAKLMSFSNMSPEDQAKAKGMGMAKPMVLNFLTTLLFAWVVSYLYPQLLALSLVEFLKVTFVIWLGFSFPIYANQAIWERKSWKLVVLNSVYSIINLKIVAVIIYYMQ